MYFPSSIPVFHAETQRFFTNPEVDAAAGRLLAQGWRRSTAWGPGVGASRGGWGRSHPIKGIYFVYICIYVCIYIYVWCFVIPALKLFMGI